MESWKQALSSCIGCNYPTSLVISKCANTELLCLISFNFQQAQDNHYKLHNAYSNLDKICQRLGMLGVGSQQGSLIGCGRFTKRIKLVPDHGKEVL